MNTSFLVLTQAIRIAILGLFGMGLIIGLVVPSANAREDQTASIAAPSIEPIIIKHELDASGKNDEWVRLEITGNIVKMIHTRVGESEASSIISTISSLLTVPTPSFYRWYDHKTTRVAFQLDNCVQKVISATSASSCLITGIETLMLPSGSNIRQGVITIEYEDRKLLRSVTFRLPKK
jgi:hypothetical protein